MASLTQLAGRLQISGYVLLLQFIESGIPQAIDKNCLGFRPDGVHGAIIGEFTFTRIADALIEQNRTIDGFDDFQECDFLRGARQRNAAARAAR